MTVELIYISNARIPSEKANSYQSVQMCNSFSKVLDSVEMWVPNSKNNKEMEPYISNPFCFYNIQKTFEVKKLFTIDLWLLKSFNEFVWANIKAVFFACSVLISLNKRSSAVVLTRDPHILRMLYVAKKIGIIGNKYYYEAHKFSIRLLPDIKYSDGLIVINNYLKELYEKQCVSNVLVAHDGVNLDEYSEVENYKYSKAKKRPILLYTGNLFKWKGVQTLVDSLDYINIDVELIVVGGSPEVLKEFRQYVKDNGAQNIVIVGFIPKKETIKYIKKADVLLLPNSSKDKMSLYTSPLKLFEYMASKRPIIASKLPSICEILDDGVNALLFNPDSPNDLADVIKYALENDCSDIVDKAYHDVFQYTWDKRAARIHEFMNS